LENNLSRAASADATANSHKVNRRQAQTTQQASPLEQEEDLDEQLQSIPRQGKPAPKSVQCAITPVLAKQHARRTSRLSK
jgi:hypothetical protein